MRMFEGITVSPDMYSFVVWCLNVQMRKNIDILEIKQ